MSGAEKDRNLATSVEKARYLSLSKAFKTRGDKLPKYAGWGLLYLLHRLMPKASKKTKHQQKPQPTELRGWKEIASFLGQPVSVAQRWAKDGMLVRRDGRSVTATPGDLNTWLSREPSGEPLHVATDQLDLSADLKRGLAYLESHKKSAPKA